MMAANAAGAALYPPTLTTAFTPWVLKILRHLKAKFRILKSEKSLPSPFLFTTPLLGKKNFSLNAASFSNHILSCPLLEPTNIVLHPRETSSSFRAFATARCPPVPPPQITIVPFCKLLSVLFWASPLVKFDGKISAKFCSFSCRFSDVKFYSLSSNFGRSNLTLNLRRKSNLSLIFYFFTYH
mgnify:CR=1 FL=1